MDRTAFGGSRAIIRLANTIGHSSRSNEFGCIRRQIIVVDSVGVGGGDGGGHHRQPDGNCDMGAFRWCRVFVDRGPVATVDRRPRDRRNRCVCVYRRDGDIGADLGGCVRRVGCLDRSRVQRTGFAGLRFRIDRRGRDRVDAAIEPS